jgi:hypothetical protein
VFDCFAILLCDSNYFGALTEPFRVVLCENPLFENCVKCDPTQVFASGFI